MSLASGDESSPDQRRHAVGVERLLDADLLEEIGQPSPDHTKGQHMEIYEAVASHPEARANSAAAGRDV